MLEDFEIPFVLFMSLCCLMGGIFNLSILIVYRKKYTNSTSLYFLTMLALVNFLNSTLIIPMVTFADLSHFYGTIFCKISYVARRFFVWMLIFLLGFIAYERYNVISAKTLKGLMLVEKNLIYQSRKLFLGIITFSFLFSLISYLISVDEKEKRCRLVESDDSFINAKLYETTTICLGLLVYLFMVVCYIRAYLIIYKSSKRVMNAKNVVKNNSETEIKHHQLKYLKKKFENFSLKKHELTIHEVEENTSTNNSSSSIILDSNRNNKNETKQVEKKIYSISNKLIENKNNFKNNITTQKKTHYSKRKDWQVAKIFILVINLNTFI